MSDQQYIGIPHQRKPKLMSVEMDGPPIEDDHDQHVEGDHDLHTIIPVEDGLEWTGHQKWAVRALASDALGVEMPMT